MRNHRCPYARVCPAYGDSNCQVCGKAPYERKENTTMREHDYVMALAMNHEPVTVLVGATKIPALIERVDSRPTAGAYPETVFACRVVNHDQIRVNPSEYKHIAAQCIAKTGVNPFDIADVIFNEKATIVKWKDGTKTVAVDKNGEIGSTHYELALCIMLRRAGISSITFEFPTTKAVWEDGTETTVTCQDNDYWSKETGLFTVIAKKALGNKGNFNDVFRKWIPEETAVEAEEPQEEASALPNGVLRRSGRYPWGSGEDAKPEEDI